MRALQSLLLFATLASPALGLDAGPLAAADESDAHVVSWAPARFTEPARRARVHGVVQILVSIDAAGRVVEREIVKNLPMGLGMAAFEASKHWKFDRSAGAERHATLEFVFAFDEDSNSLPRFEFEAPLRVRAWSPQVVVILSTGCGFTSFDQNKSD